MNLNLKLISCFREKFKEPWNSPYTSLLRIYYVLGILILLNYLWTLTQNMQHLESADWLWPLMWLGSSPSPQVFLGVIGFSVMANVLAACFPIRVFRILAAIGWVSFLAAVFSFGKINNSSHGWMLGALLLMFPSLKKPKHIELALYCTQAVCLSFYFSAGLWKAKSLWGGLGLDGFFTEIIPSILPTHIAYGVSEGHAPTKYFLEFFSNHPVLSSLAYLGVVAAQLTSPVWIFLPRLVPLAGGMFIGFHVSSALILGIGFQDHNYLLVYLFFVFPLFVKIMSSSKEKA